MRREGDGNGRSSWFWVATGCGGCAILVVGVFVTLVLLGKFAARSIRDANASPQSREVEALTILGAERLPEGYYATMVLAAPLGMFRWVALADAPPQEGMHVPLDAQRVLLYVDAVRGERPLDGIVEGDESIVDLLRSRNITVDDDGLGRSIGRGELRAEQPRVVWVAERGRLVTDTAGALAGLTTLLLIDCENDRRLRALLWTVADPDPAVPLERLDLGGTSADPQAMRELLAGFDLCAS